MQTAHTIELEEMPPVAFSSHEPQLQVVLVYEDFEMGVQGKNVFDLIAKEAGGESAARLTVWRFDFFHSAGLIQAVSRQAEEADVIIVALRNPHSVPPQVRTWLERWPQHRKTESGALVTIFPPDTNSEQAKSSNAALLLWRAACRAQMDFICRTDNTSTGGNGSDLESVTTTATMTDAPPVTINHDALPEHVRWGLNE